MTINVLWDIVHYHLVAIWYRVLMFRRDVLPPSSELKSNHDNLCSGDIRLCLKLTVTAFGLSRIITALLLLEPLLLLPPKSLTHDAYSYPVFIHCISK